MGIVGALGKGFAQQLMKATPNGPGSLGSMRLAQAIEKGDLPTLLQHRATLVAKTGLTEAESAQLKVLESAIPELQGPRGWGAAAATKTEARPWAASGAAKPPPPIQAAVPAKPLAATATKPPAPVAAKPPAAAPAAPTSPAKALKGSSAELFERVRRLEVEFPDPKVTGTSHFRNVEVGGRTTIPVERLFENFGLGRTTSLLFEDAVLKLGKARPELREFADGTVLRRFEGLDQQWPKRNVMTKESVEASLKDYDRVLADLAKLDIAAGSQQAAMVTALRHARDGLEVLAKHWKPGLSQAQLSRPRGAIFDWVK